MRQSENRDRSNKLAGKHRRCPQANAHSSILRLYDLHGKEAQRGEHHSRTKVRDNGPNDDALPISKELNGKKTAAHQNESRGKFGGERQPREGED